MPGRGWCCPKSEMENKIARNEVHFGSSDNTVPNLKTYLKNTENQSLTSLIYKDGRVASKKLARLFDGEKVFSNPKDDEVLQRLMMAFGLTSDDLVLDFFSGSGTIGEAVAKYNAAQGKNVHWLLVQLPENLEDNYRTAKGANKKITKNAINYLKDRGLKPILTNLAEERLRLMGNVVKSESADGSRQLRFDEEMKQLPDIGFRVFELDDSGIERPEPGQLVLDVVKPDRTELDIVFEMMLKWGLELTLPVEQEDAAGYPIWSVACDELVCCMSRGLTIDALEAIADMEPRRVLILDSILDDTLKLNAVQIFKHAGERMGCEIELRTV